MNKVTFAEYCEAKELLKDAKEMLALAEDYHEGEVAYQCIAIAEKIINTYESENGND